MNICQEKYMKMIFSVKRLSINYDIWRGGARQKVVFNDQGGGEVSQYVIFYDKEGKGGTDPS